jgi:heme-degrading monooxygenase HmoA
MTNFVLINPFEVPEDVDDDRFLEGWGRAADYMQSRPGFVASRLHRAVSPNAKFRFVNVAEWESPQDFRRPSGAPSSRRWRRARLPTTRPSTRSCASCDARARDGPRGDEI